MAQEVLAVGWVQQVLSPVYRDSLGTFSRTADACHTSYQLRRIVHHPTLSHLPFRSRLCRRQISLSHCIVYCLQGG
jgi:hypothetical protein